MTRRNNFDLLRLLFATLVVYSHAFPLAGSAEPSVWGSSFGNLAVSGFFVISGYLITGSYLSSPRLLRFSLSRLLRVVPGLVVALTVTGVVSDQCDSFRGNPVPYIANGPIWTLTWEILCYALVPLMGALGALSASSLPGVLAAAWLVYASHFGSVEPFFLIIAPLFLLFLSGAFLQVMDRGRIPVISLVILAFAAYVPLFQWVSVLIRDNIVFLWGVPLSDQQVMRTILLACLPSVVIYLGARAPVLGVLRHDISYGIYIYGWPVSQTVVFLQPGIGPLALFGETMAVTVLIAFASWRLIEKPALAVRRFLA
ncbi:MAG TPA: acyltransferase [Rhodopila sp.]|nr:acyltransferase [Rhodopila sp.]